DRALDSSIAANRGIQYGSGLVINQVSPQINDDEENSLARAEAFLEDPEAYLNSLDQFSENYIEEEHNPYAIESLYDQEWF
ncbi:hypothetical protein, partial [Pseudomonas sp. 2822-17]